MPSRRNPRANVEHRTPLRRSPRFQSNSKQQPEEDPSTNPNSKSVTNFDTPHSSKAPSSKSNAFVKKVVEGNSNINSKKSTKTVVGSKNCQGSVSGLRRSSRLSVGVGEISCLRRSLRFRNNKNDVSLLSADNVKKNVTTIESEEISYVRRSPRFHNKENSEKNAEFVKTEKPVRVKDGLALAKGLGNFDAGLKSCNNLVKKRKKKLSNRVVPITAVLDSGEGEVRNDAKEKKLIGVKRKRNNGEIGDRVVNGWTKEEEVTLQKAYFSVKPTPHFWKKVSRLVPGKSAQDCFNKINSDHLTPPQPRPRSRVNKTNSSPLDNFSLSASKLLKSNVPMAKKPRCNKQKSRFAHKAVRHLLRKTNIVNQDHEVDLFSILEPNTEPSIQVFPQNFLFSTPEHDSRKSRFSRSSSSGKNLFSRLSSLCPTTPLISPPVLKQVKNKALHEKYIDQLHNREAKRKAAVTRAAKSAKNGNKEECFHNVDVVKAALVSEANNAINQFHHLQANNDDDDDDDDGVGTDIDDEGDF